MARSHCFISRNTLNVVLEAPWTTILYTSNCGTLHDNTSGVNAIVQFPGFRPLWSLVPVTGPRGPRSTYPTAAILQNLPNHLSRHLSDNTGHDVGVADCRAGYARVHAFAWEDPFGLITGTECIPYGEASSPGSLFDYVNRVSCGWIGTGVENVLGCVGQGITGHHDALNTPDISLFRTRHLGAANSGG